MSEIILHHYETSPFSEKPRVMLGAKGLAWRSVIQPVIMPKPELIPLTGGYRRIPVMQIGADVYCDSKVILAEIEARHPDPPVILEDDWAVNDTADKSWFQASVAVIFAEIGAAVPREFIEDREKLSGRAFDISAMSAAAPIMRPQWRAQAEKVDERLAGNNFLGGDAPSLADIAAWMNVWWLCRATPHLAAELMHDLTRLADWQGRMAAIGHGHPSQMAPADALQVAARSQPVPPGLHDAQDPLGLAPGDPVAVAADDYGRDPIGGRLVALNRDRITLARQGGGLDMIHVHFPRAGYVVQRA